MRDEAECHSVASPLIVHLSRRPVDIDQWSSVIAVSAALSLKYIVAVNLYGIDGCKGGWVIASRSRASNAISFTVVAKLRGFISSNRGDVIAIDIPIGLSEDGPRQCDVEARSFLGRPRASSVFPAPCRPCLDAISYADACARNFAASGRMISCQCYGILPKIREIDALMSPKRQQFVREVHPEVAFALVAGRSMLHRKTTEEGIHERLRVLAKRGVVLSLGEVQEHRREMGRDLVHVDDMIDAAGCLMTAERIAQDGPTLVLGGQECDARKLRMEIVA